MGFQNYGNLTSSLQGLLGMEQSEADAHPAKRARVQVGAAPLDLPALKDLLLRLPGLQPSRCLRRWGMQRCPSGPSWRGTASPPGTQPT